MKENIFDPCAMNLEPNINLVWRGNLFTDIIFTPTIWPFSPSSILEIQAFLEMMSTDSLEEEILLPFDRLTFYDGRPDFHFFTSTNARIISNQSYDWRNSFFRSGLDTAQCFRVGARVHHDALNWNFRSFKLVLLLVTRSAKSSGLKKDHSVHALSNKGLQEKINCLDSKYCHHPDNLVSTNVEIMKSSSVRWVFLLSIQMLIVSTKFIAHSMFKNIYIHRITDYKLHIKENFSARECILQRKDVSPDTFEWYNKNGGDMVSIDVLVQLKDLSGAIVYDYPESLPVKTELLYEDGSPTPCFTKYSLKNKTNSKEKNSSMGTTPMKLFHPTRPEPLLGPGIGSQHFSFRIEEVSAHHPVQGFKLRVRPSLDTSDVFYGDMEETIIVKAKPKASLWQRRGKGGRKSILQCSLVSENLANNSFKNAQQRLEKKKKRKTTIARKNVPRKVSLDDLMQSSHYDRQSDTVVMKLSMASKIFSGCSGSTCIACGQQLKPGYGLCPSHHKSDCRFNLTLVPFALSAPEMMSSSATVAAKNYQNGIIDFTLDEEEYDEFSRDAAAVSLLALSGVLDSI